ncbi:Protein MtfA [Planctomycetes bacterium Poly30]|uniref:Protein MtfA n=1 Tax=Saltatorellus ferox TaxID=2528018 RepID=A0A518ERM5_9BACT|nr:Protein MtfA [Planctomycetes bacterium Poly30]
MLISLYRKWKRARLLEGGFRATWLPYMESLPFVAHLTPAQRTRLEELTMVLIDQVYWEGRAGLEVTDEMRVSVAAQACRLILGLGDDAYRGVRTVYLFPSTYSAPDGTMKGPGVRGEGDSHRLGEAWLRGPVVLSWRATRQGAANDDDGRNVIYHEFAHKLDMIDGYADGTPPARNRQAYDTWVEVAGREYERLKESTDRGKRTLLGSYGATNEAEFFAVATEVFFERPERMRERHEELFRCLVDFYGQTPVSGDD